MSHLRSKTEGIFNPVLKFAFTNITEEDFVSAWNGVPITVKPGQTVSLPHHLADKMTDELVDKIMITGVKTNEVEYYKNNPNTAPNLYRAPSSLGVPAARKLWEDKIVRQLDVDEESPEIQVIRAQIKEELLSDMSKETSKAPVPVPSLGDFAEIKTPQEAEVEVTTTLKAKRARKVKGVEVIDTPTE